MTMYFCNLLCNILDFKIGIKVFEFFIFNAAGEEQTVGMLPTSL